MSASLPIFPDNFGVVIPCQNFVQCVSQVGLQRMVYTEWCNPLVR